MNSPVILLILFLAGALVALGPGIVIGSPLLIAFALLFAAIGIILYQRARRHR
jgi:hypothetical protein